MIQMLLSLKGRGVLDLSAKILTVFLEREGRAYIRWRLAGNKGETDYVKARWGDDKTLWNLHTAVFKYLLENGYILEEQHLKVTTPGLNFAKKRIELPKRIVEVLLAPHEFYHDELDIKLMTILGYLKGEFFGRHVTHYGREYLHTIPVIESDEPVEQLNKEIQKALEKEFVRITTGVSPHQITLNYDGDLKQYEWLFEPLGHEEKPFYKCEVKNEGEISDVFLAKLADISRCTKPIDWENIDLSSHLLSCLADKEVTSSTPCTGEILLDDGSTLTIDTTDFSVSIADLPRSDSGMAEGAPPFEKLYDGAKDGYVVRYSYKEGQLHWTDPFAEDKEDVTTACDESPMRKLIITMVEDHQGVTWTKEVVSRRNLTGGEFLELIYPNLQIELSIAQVAEGQYTVTELDKDGPLHFGFLYVEEQTID